MASYIYDRCLELWARGNIDFDTDSFKVELLTSSYPSSDATAKTTHDFRDDLTNEVSGTGYTAGGAAATVTVALDTTNHYLNITLGGAVWSTSTITARKAAYYKSRGGAASADELIGLNDFGADVISVAGTFTLNSSTLRVANP